jgi:uncharacterized membrane protein YuzA (DUF378 family)
MSTNITFLKVKIHMVLIALVLIGGINWGTTALGYNLVGMLANSVNTYFRTNTHLDTVIYLTVAIAAIILLFKRNTWLPFLGLTAFPSQAFVSNRVNENGTFPVKVHVSPNTRVAYWASKPQSNEQVPQVKEAYDDFSNSGVVTSDNNGLAVLLVDPGTSYIVPTGREIPRHVHYRELDKTYGMMGEIKTAYY